MSKYVFPTQFECQNRILNIKIGLSDSVRMSKYVFPTQFECQNRILNIKIGFSDSVRISKNEKRKNEKRKAKNEKRKSNQLHLLHYLFPLPIDAICEI